MGRILNLENVSQHFGGVIAVNELNLHVDENEIVGLIGPNGAGKTTVFNVITGIYNPTRGKVIFDGDDITGREIFMITQRGIARTFQNIRLFKSLSVLDNVRIAMNSLCKSNLLCATFRLPKWKRAEKEILERSMELLRLTDLASLADDAAGSLPYGAQRRLEIARAMATGAKLLLLDEPAAGMNEQETIELMTFIRKINSMGYTILLIEHDMKLVMNICQRIYVLNHGELIASGIPEEIQNNRVVIDAYLGEEE